MKTVNNIKFASFDEIIAALNAGQPDGKLQYRTPELALAWADTRAKYYLDTGKQVEEGLDYVALENGEHHLSQKACELIEKYATVDGHNVPVMKDGGAALFT